MKRFLVIGLWEDEGGRWADSFTCSTPDEAESLAIKETESDGALTVAAVIELRANEAGEDIYCGIVA